MTPFGDGELSPNQFKFKFGVFSTNYDLFYDQTI